MLPNGEATIPIVACFGRAAPFMSAKLAYAAQLGSALTRRHFVNPPFGRQSVRYSAMRGPVCGR
jgi:hypothetical protein